MTQLTIDERVAALEIQVANLVKSQAKLEQASDWRGTFGMFAGDPIFKEIIEEGRKLRQEDREQAGK